MTFENGLLLLAFGGLFGALQVVEFWYQAKITSKLIVRWRLPVIMIFSLVKLCTLWVSDSLQWLVFVYAIELVFLGLVVIFVYTKDVKRIRISEINFEYSISLLKQSTWLIFSGFASVVYLKIDQVMLGQMATYKDVGVYAVASRLSEVWYFFPEAVMASFFSGLLLHRKKGQERYYQHLQKICNWLFMAAILLAVLITMFSGSIIRILYGSSYEESSLVLSIHIWAGCFVFMRSLLSKWLIAENLLRFSFFSHGLGAVVNVVLNFWMISQWSAIGAAIATVVSYAVASYLALFIYKPTRCMALVMTKSILLPLRLVLLIPKYIVTKGNICR
jgi:PST family polysaccharide transporter